MEFFRGGFGGRNTGNFSNNFAKSIPKYDYNKNSKNFYITGSKNASWYYPYYFGYPNIYYLNNENEDNNDDNKEGFNNIDTKQLCIYGSISIAFASILLVLLFKSKKKIIF